MAQACMHAALTAKLYDHVHDMCLLQSCALDIQGRQSQTGNRPDSLQTSAMSVVSSNDLKTTA